MLAPSNARTVNFALGEDLAKAGDCFAAQKFLILSPQGA